MPLTWTIFTMSPLANPWPGAVITTGLALVAPVIVFGTSWVTSASA